MFKKNKAVVICFLAVTLLIGILPVPVSAATSYKAKVTANVNVRTKASTAKSSKIVGRLKKNQTVTVTTYNSKWVKVKYKSKTRFISKSYTKKVASSTATAYKAKTTAKINVRTKPSTAKSSKIVGTLKKNQTITVTNYNKNWVKIKYKKKTRYIAKRYTKKVATTSTFKVKAGFKYRAKITAASLNIRSKASNKTGKTIGKLKKNQTVTLYTHNNNWSKINYNGKTGYIARKYTNEGLEANYKTLDFRTSSKVTVNEINNYINTWEKTNNRKSVFHNQGSMFIDVAKKANLNALLLTAMAIHESAYGTSGLSHAKYNVFSVAAYDRCAYDYAYRFDSVKHAMQYQANFLNNDYLNPANWKFKGYYLGDDKGGMNYYYASGGSWGLGVSKHANKIRPFKVNDYANQKPKSTTYRFNTALKDSYENFETLTNSKTKAIIIGYAATGTVEAYSSRAGNGVPNIVIPKGEEFQVLGKYNNVDFKIKYQEQIYYFNGKTEPQFKMKNLTRRDVTANYTKFDYREEDVSKRDTKKGFMTIKEKDEWVQVKISDWNNILR